MYQAFDQPMVARGLAYADIDDDGDLDVLVTVNDGTPKLLRNDLLGSNWIKLRLIGNPPNPNALGAKVIVWAGRLKQEKMVRTGSSYLSQSDFSTLVFGLGQHSAVDSIKIIWAVSGRLDKLNSVQAGQTYRVQETAAGLLAPE